MPYEIVTTHFVAHEGDLEAAYAVYRERIARSGAEIVTYSPHPQPIEDEFTLWDLRCQAAYENLTAPETMNLYELNALVNFSPVNRDEAIDYFFFEDLMDRSLYPSSLGGLQDLTVRDSPNGPLSLVTVAYLGRESAYRIAQQLFETLLNSTHAVAFHPAVAPLEGTDHAALVGPLWLRDATLNIIGKGDDYYSPGKEAWAGWLLTSDTIGDIELRLQERIEPDVVVLARAIAEPF